MRHSISNSGHKMQFFHFLFHIHPESGIFNIEVNGPSMICIPRLVGVSISVGKGPISKRFICVPAAREHSPSLSLRWARCCRDGTKVGQSRDLHSPPSRDVSSNRLNPPASIRSAIHLQGAVTWLINYQCQCPLQNTSIRLKQRLV